MINKSKIIEIILKYYSNCQAIYLFGSHANNSDNQQSDIDIALLLHHKEAKNIKNFLLTEIHQELENYFNKDVDLINLRQTNSTLQMQIIFNGEIIYNPDHLAKDNFEMIAISLYQKLNEERKEILKNNQYA
jgi:predicted nucleotidyltransferase